jgi:hypothetical protein
MGKLLDQLAIRDIHAALISFSWSKGSIKTVGKNHKPKKVSGERAFNFDFESSGTLFAEYRE